MRHLESALVHLVLIAAVAFALYPILWVLGVATSETLVPEPRVLPLASSPTASHFVAVVTRTGDHGEWLFARQLANSLGVATATAAVAIGVATPGAYALSRMSFVGKDTSTRALLATQMVPGVAAAVPLYLLVDALGLLDTRAGLVLVYAASAIPFALFQLRGTFDTIPKALDEAAMVDGATRLQAFVHVVLPAARPGIAVTALFAFLTAWNEFALAASFLTSETNFTLPILLQSYASEHSANMGHFAAGAVVVSIPVMVLFYALQRAFVHGLTAGSVKS